MDWIESHLASTALDLEARLLQQAYLTVGSNGMAAGCQRMPKTVKSRINSKIDSA